MACVPKSGTSRSLNRFFVSRRGVGRRGGERISFSVYVLHDGCDIMTNKISCSCINIRIENITKWPNGIVAFDSGNIEVYGKRCKKRCVARVL